VRNNSSLQRMGSSESTDSGIAITVHVCLCMCSCVFRSEGIRAAGAGVTGHCELPDMAAGN
jgi:hypothetical protein